MGNPYVLAAECDRVPARRWGRWCLMFLPKDQDDLLRYVHAGW